MSIGASTGWCGDSKPSTSRLFSPVPAPVMPASIASSRRQLAGYRPDWEISRTAAAAARKSSNSTPHEALNSGRGRTRIQASPITPRIPSEPISARSGEGPAPDPGSRLLSQVPRGVIARTDSTRSSMWVWRVAKCPPARVAIQPPRVAYSKDCGKWRRVRPCSRSCSSRRGPVAPAWIRAASDSASTSSTRSNRRRSSETNGRSPSRPSTPPTTLVPPPKGMTAAPSASAQLSTTSISDSSLGSATRSGGFSNSPLNPRTTSR